VWCRQAELASQPAKDLALVGRFVIDAQIQRRRTRQFDDVAERPDGMVPVDPVGE
jgi:hypothetical protein